MSTDINWTGLIFHNTALATTDYQNNDKIGDDNLMSTSSKSAGVCIVTVKWRAVALLLLSTVCYNE